MITDAMLIVCQCVYARVSCFEFLKGLDGLCIYPILKGTLSQLL